MFSDSNLLELLQQEYLEREMEKHYIRTTPLGKIAFITASGFFSGKADCL
jgi:hypothetical protein